MHLRLPLVIACLSTSAVAQPKPKDPGLTCSKGQLFAGNPLSSSGADRPADGTKLLEGTPFPYRTIAFSKGQLITHMGQEIWRASLSDLKLHKVAGTEGSMQLVSGPCAKARFANLAHMVVASDGSLFLSDQGANAILKVTDPLGEGCTVVRWAGAPKDIVEGISPSRRPNAGNVDGPGDKAKLGTPQRLAIDPKDNVYFTEEDNNTIRKVANDDAHTVSTLVSKVTENSGTWLSPTFMGGKVYVYGSDGSEVFVSAYGADGKKTSVLKGRADVFGYDASTSRSLGGIVNDGTSLFVVFRQRIFRVSPEGTVTPIAGDEDEKLDLPADYDPKVSRPAGKVQLPMRSMTSTAGLNAFLAIDSDNDLYVSARLTDPYVVKFECGR